MKLISFLKLWVLSKIQHKMIYKPNPPHLTPLLAASTYGLQNTEAISVSSADGITLRGWHYDACNDKPLIWFFQGNHGHIADVAVQDPEDDADPEYRLKCLHEIQQAKYSFLSVSLRNYGNSDMVKKITETGIDDDLKSVIQTLPKDKEIWIFGESLGAVLGIKAMVMAQQIGLNITRIGMINSFASMKEKLRDLHPDLLQFDLAEYMVNPLDATACIPELSKETMLHLYYSENDAVTLPRHTLLLKEAADQANIKTQITMQKGAEHITWSPEKVIANFLA